MSSQEDQRWMRLAIELAAGGEGRVEPNPMVGCVLVRDGQLIGQGFHHFFGGPHAEVDALNSLEGDASDATAYVTLEPCCHHGKTPPCSEALVKSGVSRVVVAMRDPFPKVDGGGIKHLRQAGIEVKVGVLEMEARRLVAPFLKQVQSGTPWVIAKWAMTLDGKIATTLGESQWITGESSRRQVHLLRARVDAIAVGMGTVTKDDPLLTARLVDHRNNPVTPPRVARRLVYCQHRLPSVQSKLVQTADEVATFCVCSSLVDRERLDGLRDKGVQVIQVDQDDPIKMVRDSLPQLGQLGITNLMIEGGGGLLGSFLGRGEVENLIDECHVYLGGKLFGGQIAASPIGGAGIGELAQTASFDLISVDSFDQDVRLIYRRRMP